MKQDTKLSEEGMTMTPEKEVEILSKELVAKYSHAWWIYRINIGYLDDIYRLMQDVARVEMDMPKDRPETLRSLLGKTFKALEKEEQDLTNLYGGEYMKLLEARDRLNEKEMKKAKK